MSEPMKKVSIIPAVEPSQSTAMTMIDRAISSGASMEVIEKLMALQERYEANQARKAFDAAVADAKAEIKPVVRNATGHNAKKYADFAAIATAVDPIISKHGLSYRFRTAQTDKIAVTCILSHKSGHYEETTLCGPADTSGNKNAIQSIGSTLTYLQRYSLVQALGLAASNDDDGNGVKDTGELISDEQVKHLIDICDQSSTDKAKFCQKLHVDSLAAIRVSQYANAVATLKHNAKLKGIEL